jgi:hypothetical protein
MSFQLRNQRFRFLAVFPQQSGGVIIGKEFHIQCPSFQIPPIPEQFPYRTFSGGPCQSVIIDILIEMPRVSFMGKGGV